jgi:hypothetical protein
LRIADCGLRNWGIRIADSAGVAARGVNGGDRDGDEFISFQHEQFQFRGLHQPGLDQEFQSGFMYSVFLGAIPGADALPAFSNFNPQSAIRNPHSVFQVASKSA